MSDVGIKANVRYELKTACRNGTMHVIFEPLDFIARLAALDCMDAWSIGRINALFGKSIESPQAVNQPSTVASR